MTRRILLTLICSAFVVLSTSAHAADEEAPDEGEKIDYKTLKSPIAYTETSLKRGRMLYMRRCTECHGPDGRSQIDVIADATDLTNPKLYLSGTTEGHVFRSIKEGAGVSMPPFKMQIKRDEDIWHITNFVLSLWPEDKRPELQAEEEESEDTGEDEPSEEGEGT